METASCDRCARVPLLQRSQRQHVDHVRTVEEYVLDEQDFSQFQALTAQQQRHVRRSAELRTVSIIETLSELVAGQGEGGKLDDCDGQCRRRRQTRSRELVGEPGSGSSACPCRTPERDGGANGQVARRPGARCCDGKTVDSSGGADVRPCCGEETLGKMQGRGAAVKAAGCIHRNLQWSSTTAFSSQEQSSGGVPSDQKRVPKKGQVAAATNGCGHRPEEPTNSGSTMAARLPRAAAAAQKAVCRSAEAPGAGLPKRCGHDPSHFMLSTLRSKGRTPDWIAGIFSIARRGNLERLSQALVGMDATLIRNLSDHRGNNLFHVCCCYGHLDSLQWLMQRGKQCEDAILDENKYELTPLVCAVKYGKLPCVEWLIQNTVARGQLVPSNGTRPLLHWAAKYGQEVILRWLAEYMEHNSMDVNVKDGHGNTALHLAAKHGHAVSIKALVIHRCDASIKNDIGYKASDYASLYGQTACSEYLLSLEACLLLSSDVATLDADIYSSRAEMSETKIQFKDVLSCAKKLVKEREELSQHLDRLQDGLVHLNDVIVTAIQGLCEENGRLRERVDGRRHCENSQSVDETIALCHAMQTRWKDGQQRWLSSTALGEIQQKIFLAEERWKRARVRSTWEHKESKEYINVFRERLAQVQCRATGIRLSEIRSISSSESSLASLEDTMSEYEERYELCENAKPFSAPIFSDNKLRSRGCGDPSVQCHDVRQSQQFGFAGANKTEPCVNRRTQKAGFSPESSPFKAASLKPVSKQSAVLSSRSKDAGHLLKNGHNVGLVSQGTCKVLEIIVSSGNESDGGSRTKCGNGIPGDDSQTVIRDADQPWTVDAYSETGLLEQVSNLMARNGEPQQPQQPTKRTKLGGPTVTTRGHCKSEILESRGNNDGDDEDKRRNASDRLARDQSSAAGSSNGIDKARAANGGGESQQKGNNSNDNGRSDEQQQQQRDGQEKLLELFEEFRIVTPPVPRAKSPSLDNNGKLVSSEPDLIIGTKGIRASRSLPNALSPDIPEVLTLEGSDVEPDPDGVVADQAATAEFGPGESAVVETDPDESAGLVACSNGNPIKRRGFLHKLNLRWPSKRKPAPAANGKKVQEISPENFRETYLHVRNGTGEDGEPLLEQCSAAPETFQSAAADSASLDGALAGSSVLPEFNDGGLRGEACEVNMSSSSSSRCSLAAARSPDNSFSETHRDECSSQASAGSRNPRLVTGCAEPASQGRSEDSMSYPKRFPVAPAGPRNIPVPPLPDDPPIGPEDLESACSESQAGYGYAMMPGAQSRQNRSECSRDEEDDDEDEDEEHKDSSRPEADQDIPLDKGLDIAQCNLIHAQANMPPQRPLSEQSGGFLSRPESSVSRAESYSAVFRLPGYPLRKVSSVSTDLLTPDRMSPAPSEVSKTESALSPPSDISKTESVRHMRQLTRIEERGKRAAAAAALTVPALPAKCAANVKVAAIVDVNAVDCVQKQEEMARTMKLTAAGQGPAAEEEPETKCSKRGTSSAVDKGQVSVPDVSNVADDKCLSKEKPWYELSDDEEILMPETLKRNIIIAKSSSEEDEAYICA